jgi:outer membrane usher protein
VGAGEVELEHFDGDNNLRADVTGSIGLVDGQIRPSRRLGQAFGLVSVPGFANVRVYLDNREVGRTDPSGHLMLPDLRPYEANRVRLELDDLPLDARMTAAEATAVPYARAGVTVGFDVRRERQGTARLVDPVGQPLPAGLQLARPDGLASAWIAKDGFAEVTGADHPLEVSGDGNGQRYVCTVPAMPENDLLADLGEIRCR